MYEEGEYASAVLAGFPTTIFSLGTPAATI